MIPFLISFPVRDHILYNKMMILLCCKGEDRVISSYNLKLSIKNSLDYAFNRYLHIVPQNERDALVLVWLSVQYYRASVFVYQTGKMSTQLDKN